MNGNNNSREKGQKLALTAALGAFATWGVLPIYWKNLAFIDPFTILLHRIFWSFIFLLLLMLFSGKLRATLAMLRHRRTAITVAACSLLLSANWLIFIWAVNAGHIVESSLGYFLNPLLNMVFGVFFFKERPTFLQWSAIFLAFCGVGVQVIMFGRLPWIALSLAFTFAAYGVLRKTETIDSMPGLFLETSITVPFVTIGLIWLGLHGDTGFTTSIPQSLLIMCAGIFTSVPLIFFAFSAQRLSLTTVGLVQYISPSTSLLIGVFLYGEVVGLGHLISFALIWTALAIYTIASLHIYKKALNHDWRAADKNSAKNSGKGSDKK